MANAKSAPAAEPRLFDTATAPGGYTWWYADGLSRDGEYGFTLIAFVGSVENTVDIIARQAIVFVQRFNDFGVKDVRVGDVAGQLRASRFSI